MILPSPALELGAGLAVGLMMGIERGWRLRREKSGTRIAGVRTFALLGVAGALAARLGETFGAFSSAAIIAALVAVLIVGFIRDRGRRDSTTIVAAILAVAFGALAGAGEPALAVAAAAVVTLILATRSQSHSFVARLNTTDVQAFARYAVIAAAVLPFLPNRQVGPLDSWNPFQLWLVVVLVTGFSFLGYVANRTIGERRGVLATALIGGAYSSTAVTASFAQRLGAGEEGPLTAGILIASAVMYVRVIILVTILSPSTLPPFVVVTGPAALAGAVAALVGWFRAKQETASDVRLSHNPIELLPAFGFAAIVAAGALATRWAQQEFGQSGIAASLFVTGTFDVDAAIVTLSGLPVRAIERPLAALAIAGTIIANMLLKMFVAAVYARRASVGALFGLGASTAVLVIAVLIGGLTHLRML
ncbi:MAG TPA: MgtC/SapB family protein [Sphingomicrobium sp.]|nr:MgtC/SapB family protein [Sphingomicrobium sp.]